MKILTKQGQVLYKEWVKSVKTGIKPRENPPQHLLDQEDCYFSFHTTAKLPEINSTTNKFDFINSITPLIDELENSEFDQSNFPLVYDTIALQYFRFIVPDSPKNIFGLEFYCYDEHAQRKYRHRILGPLKILRAGGKYVEPFFQVLPSVMGEFESNIGSRQQIAENTELLKLIKELYSSSGSPSPLKGYTTTEKFSRKGLKIRTVGKPGTIRRFGEVVNQFVRIYDIYDIDQRTLVEILPNEFDAWVKS